MGLIILYGYFILANDIMTEIAALEKSNLTSRSSKYVFVADLLGYRLLADGMQP